MAEVQLRLVTPSSGGDGSVRELAPPSFEELFRQYSRYVATIGMRLLGRAHEVDDLVQDVFLEAHRGLGGLRQPTAIRGWLATVTVRLARRHLRFRRLKALVWGADADGQWKVVATSASPADQVLLAQVYRLLDRVAVNDRIAWTLRHIQGHALKEVAQLCGCSLATAKRRIASTQLFLDGEMADG